MASVVESAKRGLGLGRQPSGNILDVAISAGLTPEPNLKIGERGKGRRNRPYQMESTVAQIRGRIYTNTAHSNAANN